MKSDMIFVEVSKKRFGKSSWHNYYIRIDRHTIDKTHQELCEMNPNSFINFHWDEGNSFIYGAPHQMMIDQDKLSIDEYMSKWYGI